MLNASPTTDNSQQNALYPSMPGRLAVNSPQHADSSRSSCTDSLTSTPSSLASVSSIHRPLSPVCAFPAVLSYVQSLSRIAGVIINPFHYARTQEESVPTGISRAVDAYLDAHGYNAEAKLTIRFAWDSFDDVDEFVEYLCLKGMANIEANWIFCCTILA